MKLDNNRFHIIFTCCNVCDDRHPQRVNRSSLAVQPFLFQAHGHQSKLKNFEHILENTKNIF